MHTMSLQRFNELCSSIRSPEYIFASENQSGWRDKSAMYIVKYDRLRILHHPSCMVFTSSSNGSILRISGIREILLHENTEYYTAFTIICHGDANSNIGDEKYLMLIEQGA